MRTTTALLAALAITSCTKAPPDRPGPQRAATKTGQYDARFILVMGQSNAVGPCTANRMSNAAWAYKGISALPLAARTTQEPYGFDATNLFTYWKTNSASDDQSLDNGSWQPYELGVNSGIAGNGTSMKMGPEYGMAIKLRDHYAAPIHIIKAAFGSTGLHPNTASSSSPPGTWAPNGTHPGNQYIAVEYYARRAVRDFRAANPEARCLLSGIVWWQGETDANANITQTQYYNRLNNLWNYALPELAGIFDNDSTETPQVCCVRLKFRMTTKEASISAATQQVCNERPHFTYIDTWPYPRCQDLTTAQASPIAKGTPNSLGGQDNQHASHIMVLAVSELCGQAVIDHAP